MLARASNPEEVRIILTRIERTVRANSATNRLYPAARPKESVGAE